MNKLVLLVALLASAVLVSSTLHASSHHRISSHSFPSRRFFEGRQMELIPMLRPRRVPHQQIFCGRKLVRYVLGICGGACRASTGIDIATTCCASQCDEGYIRKACCPL